MCVHQAHVSPWTAAWATKSTVKHSYTTICASTKQRQQLVLTASSSLEDTAPRVEVLVSVSMRCPVPSARMKSEEDYMHGGGAGAKATTTRQGLRRAWRESLQWAAGRPGQDDRCGQWAVGTVTVTVTEWETGVRSDSRLPSVGHPTSGQAGHGRRRGRYGQFEIGNGRNT